MILDIDAGNSFVKWRVKDISDVIASGSESTEQVSKQGDVCADGFNIGA